MKLFIVKALCFDDIGFYFKYQAKSVSNVAVCASAPEALFMQTVLATQQKQIQCEWVVYILPAKPRTMHCCVLALGISGLVCTGTATTATQSTTKYMTTDPPRTPWRKPLQRYSRPRLFKTRTLSVLSKAFCAYL